MTTFERVDDLYTKVAKSPWTTVGAIVAWSWISVPWWLRVPVVGLLAVKLKSQTRP